MAKSKLSQKYKDKQARWAKIDPNQPLTRKQELFCQYYVSEANGTRAAELAGYSTPASQAVSNLQKPNVKRRIEELSAPLKQEEKKKARDKRAVLWSIIESPTATANDICRALDILNKMDGAYITKTEITTNKPQEKLSSMSDEELLNIISIGSKSEERIEKVV